MAPSPQTDLGGNNVLQMGKTSNGEQTTLTLVAGAKKKFTFDHSFDSFAPGADNFVSQADVFAALGVPIIENVVNGFNSTLLAYGQTGSGKSFSMTGGDGADAGVIPRLCSALFSRLSEHEHAMNKVTVEVEYFEIYSEKVYDLLAPNKKGAVQ